MPRLRRLSGAEIIAILGRFGFVLHARRGSHAKRYVLSRYHDYKDVFLQMHELRLRSLAERGF
jgi:predicted RNA binding protein YcfA (HicA-like mRNA interferase family)